MITLVPAVIHVSANGVLTPPPPTHTPQTQFIGLLIHNVTKVSPLIKSR